MNSINYISISFFTFLFLSFQLNASDIKERIEKSDLKEILEDRLGGLDEGKSAIEVGFELIDRHFESKPRSIVTVKYGQAFPLHPEILFNLGREIKGKRVLEIAGASGENGILLGLMGAESVTINDIDLEEIKTAKNTIKKLPESFQKLFSVLPGDCFEVFNDEKFNGKYELIVARNIYHFLSKKDAKRFVALVHRLLAPGGKLYISANSAHGKVSNNLLKDNPYASIFRSEMLVARTKKNDYPILTELDVEESPENINPFAYQFINKGKFTSDRLEMVGELGPNQHNALKSFLLKNVENMSYFASDGTIIAVHVSHVTCFTVKSIVKGFLENDLFEQEFVANITFDGHICDEENSKLVLICSIVVKK